MFIHTKRCFFSHFSRRKAVSFIYFSFYSSIIILITIITIIIIVIICYPATFWWYTTQFVYLYFNVLFIYIERSCIFTTIYSIIFSPSMPSIIIRFKIIVFIFPSVSFHFPATKMFLVIWLVFILSSMSARIFQSFSFNIHV